MIRDTITPFSVIRYLHSDPVLNRFFRESCGVCDALSHRFRSDQLHFLSHSSSMSLQPASSRIIREAPPAAGPNRVCGPQADRGGAARSCAKRHHPAQRGPLAVCGPRELRVDACTPRHCGPRDPLGTVGCEEPSCVTRIGHPEVDVTV